MTWTADDAIFAELRNWLVEQGFIVLSDHYDADSFGNQVVELARPIGIRLARDRGQWMIDIAGPDGVWAPLQEWSGSTGKTPPVSAAEQAELLQALVGDVELRSSE